MQVEPLRRRTWELLEPADEGDDASRYFDLGIRALIALNVLAVILETVPSVRRTAGPALHVLELVSVAVFSVEYLLRVWSCTASDRYRGAVRGRLRFAITPLALIDLFAVLPAFLPAAGVDLRVLRGARLFRLFRILKLARYSASLRLFGRVFRRRGSHLVVAFSLTAFLLLIASTVMYYAEHAAQPETFASIPHALWWGVVTLTTVGYGDAVPVTVLGRMMAAVFALSGILLIAVPTAILGAGFVEEMEDPGGDGAG